MGQLNYSHHLISGFLLLMCIAISAEAQSDQKPQQGKGIQTGYIDTTVSPCDNFFEYANGNWLKTAVIPADRSSWGSFNEVQDKNLEIIHKILDEAAADKTAPEGGIQWKVGKFYRMGMDSATIEKEKLSPLKNEFARIDKIKNLTTESGPRTPRRVA